MKKVFVMVGTRPEAIKMIPLYQELCRNVQLQVSLVSSGQHRELLDSAFAEFGVSPDHDLRIMQPGQTLSQITARILLGLEELFRRERPDLLLAHGDTNTCFATALAGFYHRIPFFHVEAGLRTHDLESPFPEEFNRQSVAQFATHHFAPTATERQHLIAEGVRPGSITVSGNTILDAISAMAPKRRQQVLLTLHRREKGEAGLRTILETVRRIAARRTDLAFVFPVHPSPSVQRLAREVFEGAAGVELRPALPYREFLRTLHESELVLTDSGGIQEEAAALQKRTLILRDQTERAEGLAAGGLIQIVGTEPLRVELAIHEALPPPMRAESPSRKIAGVVAGFLA
jgi:UDP-N-acetylglucosamine 2-epimerase (non-hydrolysing)